MFEGKKSIREVKKTNLQMLLERLEDLDKAIHGGVKSYRLKNKEITYLNYDDLIKAREDIKAEIDRLQNNGNVKRKNTSLFKSIEVKMRGIDY